MDDTMKVNPACVQADCFKQRPRCTDTRHKLLHVGVYWEKRDRRRHGWRAQWAENGCRRRRWFDNKHDAVVFLMGKGVTYA